MSSLNELVKERRNYLGKFEEYRAAELKGDGSPGLTAFEEGTNALESMLRLLRLHSDWGSTPPSSSGISSLMTPCDG